MASVCMCGCGWASVASFNLYSNSVTSNMISNNVHISKDYLRKTTPNHVQPHFTLIVKHCHHRLQVSLSKHNSPSLQEEPQKKITLIALVLQPSPDDVVGLQKIYTKPLLYK